MSTMSSIDDLFAKKDRKKKRAAARLAQQAAVSNQETGSNTVPNPAPNPTESVSKSKSDAAPPSQSTQSDDGWIEIEDVRGSQVNTGGRTVVEFRRHAEEKSNANETTTPAEKFSGWGKQKPSPDAGNTEDDSETTTPSSTQVQQAVGVSSDLAFPSLADAAKIQIVAPPQTNSVQSSSFGNTTRGPPRININTEKLREKIELRNAADGIFPSKPPASGQTTEVSSGAFSGLSRDTKVQSSSANPSLSTQTPAVGSTGRRPRFVLDKEKLREKMEKRNAAPPS